MDDHYTKIISDTRKAGTWLAYRRAAGRLRQLLRSGVFQPDAMVKVAFLSSFTVEPIVDFTIVDAADCGIGLGEYIAPYGQVSQELLHPRSDFYAFGADVTILIAEADSLAQNPEQAADELVKLSQAWQEKSGTGILVVCTFMASPDWPLHLLDTERDDERKKANHRLKETFKESSRIQVCDLDGLAAYYGYANAISPEMAAMARVPFAEGFLALLAKKFVSCLNAHTGLTRKCLVLDCDNTLWGGIIGEDGIDGIALGPDWPGREYVNFQKAVLELYEQGVILAINSKNNPADVMQVLRDHPHMVLKEDHFAAICVNWDPKPQNMQRLAKEINIGLDSLVFADDNPAERDLMQQMLPQVAVLNLPDNPALYEKTLRETNFFVRASLTEEDKQRGQMYAAQRQRNQLQQSAPTLESYLKSLEMTCSIRRAEQNDVKRAAQLTRRTNQFNLTTRRYTETDIRQMLESPKWNIYVLGLKDKFGDNGTVGLAMVEKQEGVWRIDTFLMSCRVIGRQAEDALVDHLCRDAAEAGAAMLRAEYIKTPKNAVAADFWNKMGFEQSRDSYGAGITKPGCDEKTTHYQRNLKSYHPKTFEYLTINNQ